VEARNADRHERQHESRDKSGGGAASKPKVRCHVDTARQHYVYP
jgi:hypothetical protein